MIPVPKMDYVFFLFKSNFNAKETKNTFLRLLANTLGPNVDKRRSIKMSAEVGRQF